jgi:preprotein translocase subunit SecB
MTGTPAPGTVEMVAHYVRDLSFEHPNAPHSLMTAKDAVPEADVQVSFRQIEAHTFESFITITASAKAGDVAVALVELSYAGTYRLPDISAEARERFLLVDAPRDLFPFARALIGLVTQCAGIPPLLISAPDFQESYRISSQQNLIKQAAG